MSRIVSTWGRQWSSSLGRSVEAALHSAHISAREPRPKPRWHHAGLCVAPSASFPSCLVHEIRPGMSFHISGLLFTVGLVPLLEGNRYWRDPASVTLAAGGKCLMEPGGGWLRGHWRSSVVGTSHLCCHLQCTRSLGLGQARAGPRCPMAGSTLSPLPGHPRVPSWEGIWTHQDVLVALGKFSEGLGDLLPGFGLLEVPVDGAIFFLRTVTPT